MSLEKTIATLLTLAAAATATFARAETPPPPVTITLAAGAEQNTIRIWLTSDGYSYVIDSAAPLEVGGTICKHPPANESELVCEAPRIAGFVVNAGSHDDRIVISRAVQVPVTLHGGAGRDTLLGGAGADMITGGPGDDVLGGRGGDDAIFGGPGGDLLKGGPGDDLLRGGAGRDETLGGPGSNVVS
jgi:Ca2+-binding RTX toxin-like protein